MVLVGSRALSKYIDLNRKLGDFDIWVKSWNQIPKFLKNIEPVKSTDISRVFLYEGDIFDLVKIKDPTDIEIYDRSSETISLFSENLKCANLEDLFYMTEVSSLLFNRVKYKSDLAILKSKYALKLDSSFVDRRFKETSDRLKKSRSNKKEFFHKYDLPEDIEHDLLHEWVADHLNLKVPTYKLFIEGDTTPKEEFFNNLPLENKLSRFVEETMVLSFERWLVPKLIELGAYNSKVLDVYFNLDNPACPPRKLLNHVCIKGLRDEPVFMKNFGTVNFTKIEPLFLSAVESLKESDLLRNLIKEVRKIRKVRNENIS